MHPIPIQKPTIDARDLEAIQEPLKTGWLVQGPFVAQFERLVSQYTGIKHAVATTSCTTALHLALAVAGIGPGDEVIVPALTFVATANAVVLCGARPVFCDIDPSTFVAGAGQIEKHITDKTKCIIPVSLFGMCCPMDEINAVADRHGLIVIEDAACSLGSWRRGRHAGSQAHMSVLSFHPRKVITTGEGGMLLTEDAVLADRARMMRDHGAGKSDLTRHEDGGSLLPDYGFAGFNYRMTDIQGALGVSQMGKLGHILEKRREAAQWYQEVLKDLHWLIPPAIPDGDEPNYQSYVCLVCRPNRRMPAFDDIAGLNIRRNRLMGALEKAGVATRQGTHAVHTLSAYKNRFRYDETDFHNAFLVDRLSITLPLFPGMSWEDVSQVVGLLKENWQICAV